MASRHTAARPKRDGETFARTHHHDPSSNSATAGTGKDRLRFDPRNPSALAPDARDEDDDDNEDLLAADVVGRSATIKRNAVNIDGFDSDSDNDNINAQADARAKRRKKQNKAGDFDKQMDQYGGSDDDGEDEDEEGGGSDIDMFAEDKDDDNEDGAQKGGDGEADAKKAVRFLEADEIVDQDANSRDRTRISLDPHDRGSSDDEEEEIKLAAAEEAMDDEVGAGGLKRNAPKIEAFNLRQEMDEGRFDQEGNYVRKAIDPDARHDTWLAGVSKKDIKKAAEAHEKRQVEANQRRLDEALIQTSDLLGALIGRLDRGETSLEALARLAKRQQPKQKQKKVPKWKLKKQQQHREKDAVTGEDGGTAMDEDEPSKTTTEDEDPEQRRIKAEIDAITDAADKLLARDYEDVYDQERELLQRAYRRETGSDWVAPVEPTLPAAEEEQAAKQTMWEYRWTDGRGDGAKQGPFDGSTMKAWQDAGYFGEGVEFQEVGDQDGWTLVPAFV